MDTLEREMRDWLIECFDADDDQEQIYFLTYQELEQSIKRYYSGGMTEFIKCSGIVGVE